MEVKQRELKTEDGIQKLVLTLVASADEVNTASNMFFEQIGRNDIPGFRKGKVPRQVLEQSVGGHDRAMGGVAECLINEMAFGAIDEADVVYIAEPEFKVENKVIEGHPFEFSVSGQVAPQMELTNYDPVAINMPPEEATDFEVERRIAQIQDAYHSFVAVKDEEHVAAMGDVVETLAKVTKDGRAMSGLNGGFRMFTLGDGNMPAEFDQQLVGAKKGDVLEFDFDATTDGETPEILHAEIQIEGFRERIVPEIDDELAGKVGCVDVKDLYHQTRMAINTQKANELPKVMIDRAVNAALDRLDGEVPAYYVDFIRQDVGREFMRSLEAQGTNLQQWMLQNSIEGNAMKEQVQIEAERRARIDCMLEAVFRYAGLEVTEEDIAKMFEGEHNDDASREAYENAHRMSNIRKMIRQTKASEWLVDHAEVTVVEE